MSWTDTKVKVVDIEYVYSGGIVYVDNFDELHLNQAYDSVEGRCRGNTYTMSEGRYRKVATYNVLYTLLTTIDMQGDEMLLWCIHKAPAQIGDEIQLVIDDWKYKNQIPYEVKPKELAQGNITRQNMINDFVSRNK